MAYYNTREECEAAILGMTLRGEPRIFQITKEVINNSDLNAGFYSDDPTYKPQDLGMWDFECGTAYYDTREECEANISEWRLNWRSRYEVRQVCLDDEGRVSEEHGLKHVGKWYLTLIRRHGAGDEYEPPYLATGVSPPDGESCTDGWNSFGPNADQFD